MILRYEMPEGRYYDLDDDGVIYRQKVSEGGAGASFQVWSEPPDKDYYPLLAEILVTGKVIETWT